MPLTPPLTDEKGEPLPGANVIVKGTSNGPATNADGRYSIQAPAGAMLVFSFVGYAVQEVPLNGRTTLDVRFTTPEAQTLNVVVVVGQTAKALAAVNRVRVRAGLAPLAAGLSQDALRQAIWQERRVELALEYGDRYFDLVRTGRAAAVLKAAGKGFVENKNELMPIPLSQITLSGGKLTQNPGY